MPVVKFIKEKVEITVPDGANLRAEAVKAGVNLNKAITGVTDGIDNVVAAVNKYINCSNLSGGFLSGSCGTCRVKITKGMENTNSMGMIESFRFHNPLPDPFPSLSYIGNEDTMRLACRVQVLGDIEVETDPELNLFGENFFS